MLTQGLGLGQYQNKALAILQHYAAFDDADLLFGVEARELLCQPSGSLGPGNTQEAVIVTDIDQFGLTEYRILLQLRQVSCQGISWHHQYQGITQSKGSEA